MESSSKIEVYFRKKPFFSISNEDKDIINLTETSINIENCKPRVNKNQYFSSYKNLNILTDNLNNYEIYERTIKQDISNLKSNLLIAYGQTGSGKTHTLTGTNSEIGIIPIAIAQLLDKNIDIELRVLEVYNDNIYDLVSDNISRLEIYEYNQRLKYKVEPQIIHITSQEKLYDTIVMLNNKRKTGNTKLNDRSSRAHTLYFFYCKKHNFSFNAIDLAGNERGSLTNAKSFLENQEYISINKSLFALKECIRGIYLNKKYIPYRRSKLTMLLREILYQNINIHFIGTINSSKICYPDIIDTIEYGICLKKSNIKKLLRNDIKPKEILKNSLSAPNMYISINELSRTCSKKTLVSNDSSTLVKRCKSAPNVSRKNEELDEYYKFIISHYNYARKHQKIYNYLKNTNGKIDGDKMDEIRKIINRSTITGIKFLDKFL